MRTIARCDKEQFAVRPRTDKAGALPPGVYSKTTKCVSKVIFSEEINGGTPKEEDSCLTTDV